MLVRVMGCRRHCSVDGDLEWVNFVSRKAFKHVLVAWSVASGGRSIWLLVVNPALQDEVEKHENIVFKYLERSMLSVIWQANDGMDFILEDFPVCISQFFSEVWPFSSYICSVLSLKSKYFQGANDLLRLLIKQLFYSKILLFFWNVFSNFNS